MNLSCWVDERLARPLMISQAASLEDFDARMRSQGNEAKPQILGRPRGFDDDGKTEGAKNMYFTQPKPRGDVFMRRAERAKDPAAHLR